MGGRFCSLYQTHSECESTLVVIMFFCPEVERRSKTKTKKRSLPKIEEFLTPESSEDQKKKGLHRNVGLNSAGICGIYLCCQALFHLFNQLSNLDGGTLNLNGGLVPLTI